eukprot:11295258-Alexandrium_andersonii.AAC.1
MCGLALHRSSSVITQTTLTRSACSEVWWASARGSRTSGDALWAGARGARQGPTCREMLLRRGAP